MKPHAEDPKTRRGSGQTNVEIKRISEAKAKQARKYIRSLKQKGNETQR
jgi:hypothetical protein